MPASSAQPPITLAPQVWLFIDGAWVDVSSYVLYAEGISVERGRQSESDSIDYSKCTLTLLNTDGRFSPRLPSSPYFGLLGRNTPIRVSRGPIDETVTRYLYLPGTTASYVACPDTAGNSVTGDLELILDVALDSWRDAQDLIAKYRVDGNQRSWAVNMDATGLVQFVWSADGTNTTASFSTIPIPDPGPGKRLALRITFDVNNGAAGNDVKFYTAPTSAGPWTQMGATVTTAGTTSVFNSTSKVVVGDILTSGNPPMAGKVYGFKLLNGLAGTEVANPDFTAQDLDTESFADAAGNTWTVTGPAQFVEQVAGPFRFHGEVSEWPVVSDITGNLVTVSIEAAGIWRRLSQNEQPLNSAMFRAHTNPSLTRVKGYWSLEDGQEATQIASNTTPTIGFPMRITGSPELASYDGWTASAAMPTMRNASFAGRVRGYTASGEASVYMFLFIATAVTAETSLFQVVTSGGARTFDVRLLANGNTRLKAYDDAGAAIDDGAGNLDSELGFALNGRGFMMISLQLFEIGSDVKWYLVINDFTNTDVITGALAGLTFTGTITGQDFKTITSVNVGAERGLDDVIIGHVTASNEITSLLYDVGDAVNAYNGENPATRLLRLCGEEKIPIDIAAAKAVFTGNSVTMGDQTIQTLTDLLEEVETTDLGILHESRDRFALRYRTRLSLANQEPALTLSHAGHELADTLHPIDDDQQTINEQYVIREKGIKAFKAKTSGKISTLKPRQGGVGRYPAEKTISVTYDQQVDDQASFRLRLGTVDEARYPEITLNLHHPAFTGNPALLAAALALDIGDRVVVTDLPDYLPPDDLSVLVHGYTEKFDQFTHTITLSCIPESPWEWAVADDTVKRADTDGSTTSGAFVTGTDTSMTVVTTSGPVWTTKPTSFPFNIRVAGAVLEVTAVSGATSPQTFTITQTPLNGVIKTIPSGSDVVVANPAYVGMV